MAARNACAPVKRRAETVGRMYANAADDKRTGYSARLIPLRGRYPYSPSPLPRAPARYTAKRSSALSAASTSCRVLNAPSEMRTAPCSSVP